AGGIVWRYAAERFAASVIVSDGQPVLWYAGGSQADLMSAALYRVDVRTGDRKQIAIWRRPERVDQAWIACAGSRVFVAAVAPDLDSSTLQIAVAAFDAATGAKLWEQSERRKANLLELNHLLEQFTPHNDSVTYSCGSQRRAFRAADGSALPAPPDRHVVAKVSAPPAFLWQPSGFRVQTRRLYAFTPDGRAYAMGF